MDYKSKTEMAKQLRDSVDTFLEELASQDEHLEIVSKRVNTAINYYGTMVAAVFFHADSIRIKVSGRAMLQMYYAQLQSESIPCSYEYDDSHTTYGRMFIGINAPYAQKALKSIILTVQNSKSSKQANKTAGEVVSDIVRSEESVSESTKTSDATIHPELSSVMVASKQAAANEATPLEVHSVLTGKVIKMLVCADLRLGVVSAERLDMKQSHTWQAARDEKYANLIDKASQNNATYSS